MANPIPSSSSSTSGSSFPIWLIVLILILLGIGGFFAFKFFSGGFSESTGTEDSTNDGEDDTEDIDEDEIDATSTPTPTTTPTDEAVVIPDGWQAVENSACGYTVYRPAGWYYRMFPNCMLGLDPNPIPTQSEYAGAVVIMKHSGTVATQVASLKADMEAGATESTVTISGRTWTLVEGTFAANEINDQTQVKAYFTDVSGKTFRVWSFLAPATFAMYEDELDTEVEVIVFN